MAPTLPQLPQSQDGRPAQSKQHSEPNNNTLPQLNKSDGLTRQPSFLNTPRDKDKSHRNRTDDYGNPLPLTPAGKSDKTSRCFFSDPGKDPGPPPLSPLFTLIQVPSALALQSATHNIISCIIVTNMSISNNNKYLDKCILRVLQLCSHETYYVQVMVTAQACVYTVATEWTYVHSVCTVWSYVCSVRTEWIVLLVPLILLVIVDVLADTSAQINVTKDPERGQIELSKLLSQQFCCSNNCMSMDGHDVTLGSQYRGRFKRR